MDVPANLDHLEVFPWNQNFETGVEQIDAQHRKLVDLLNQLANTLTHNDSAAISQALNELADYADYHFATEETIWRQFFSDDEWLRVHQHNHGDFLPQIRALQESGHDQPLQDTIEQIVKFLIRWLAFHIIDEDKRMALVVRAVKGGASLDQAKATANEAMSGSFQVLIDTVMNMYDGLSSRTLSLMRERYARIQAERDLREANRQLELLSITDQLTGLYNRRHFDALCSTEIRRAQRDRLPLYLLILDIDRFKHLNDGYGHAAGDQALKQVGQRLRALCRRPGDMAFRLGGEEFAVISAGQSGQGAFALGDYFRAQIEDLAFPNRFSDVSEWVTTSIGVAGGIPDADETLERLMKRADQHLYAAKRAGRNRVVTDDCDQPAG